MMNPDREPEELAPGDPVECAVSPDAALQLIRILRKQSGGVALAATALLASADLGLLLAATEWPVLFLAAVAGVVPLCGMLKRGLRDPAIVAALDRATRLTPPLSAVLINHVLLLGTRGTPRETWCTMQLTEEQQSQIRTLALPSAYIPRR